MKSNQLIINHFQKIDLVIYNLFEKYGFSELKFSGNYFLDLLESIINQQLSAKAGTTIWNRFQRLFTDGKITPENVARENIGNLRLSGVSNAKAQYIKNIAEAFINRTIMPEEFETLSDKEIINQLVKVKGIGPWTAEMFLIFSLGRKNIFSMGDAGLVRAMQKLYSSGKVLSKNRIKRIIQKWSPYKSYACLMLWKSLDNTPL